MFIDGTFKYVDTDHDGVMVKGELAAVFDYLDVDHDGKLSYAEYTKYDGASAESQLTHDVFNHFDTNKDGFLQRTEYVDTLFSQMDHNGDGQVTRHDYDHFFTNTGASLKLTDQSTAEKKIPVVITAASPEDIQKAVKEINEVLQAHLAEIRSAQPVQERLEELVFIPRDKAGFLLDETSSSLLDVQNEVLLIRNVS
uniref:EF-hand domain-containing protein n=1 Tax=Magallana gigas TaxID=29159 RepID=K1Q427_MAGGI